MLPRSGHKKGSKARPKRSKTRNRIEDESDHENVSSWRPSWADLWPIWGRCKLRLGSNNHQQPLENGKFLEHSCFREATWLNLGQFGRSNCSQRERKREPRRTDKGAEQRSQKKRNQNWPGPTSPLREARGDQSGSILPPSGRVPEEKRRAKSALSLSLPLSLFLSSGKQKKEDEKK